MIDLNAPEESSSPLKRIGKLILQGFLIIVPVIITIWLLVILYNALSFWANFIIHLKICADYKDSKTFIFVIKLISVLLDLIFLYLVGVIAKYTITKKVFSALEKWLLKLPMLNIVYSTSKQIVKAIQNPTSGMFQKVVLFEYPRKGLYVIGFLTNDNKTGFELSEKTGKDLISIFLPTTPNPTSGFLILIPRADCTFLDMSITEAMRLIISGGAIAPGAEPIITSTEYQK